jgi:hypothetical protein
MKNPVWKIYFALGILALVFLGCTLVPASVLPATTPEPISTVVPLPSMTPLENPTDPRPALSDPGQASPVAELQTVEFIGRKFELKFKATDKPVQIYEYYLLNESPADWIELVEFQVYPVNPNGNQPIDFAQRTADAFIQQYPDMQYALFTDKNSEAVMLDFFYPTSTRQGFLEFDAFKYMRDTKSSQVISFHYAKNIEAASATRSSDDVLSELKKTRKEIEAALAKFDPFGQ